MICSRNASKLEKFESAYGLHRCVLRSHWEVYRSTSKVCGGRCKTQNNPKILGGTMNTSHPQWTPRAQRSGVMASARQPTICRLSNIILGMAAHFNQALLRAFGLCVIKCWLCCLYTRSTFARLSQRITPLFVLLYHRHSHVQTTKRTCFIPTWRDVFYFQRPRLILHFTWQLDAPATRL